MIGFRDSSVERTIGGKPMTIDQHRSASAARLLRDWSRDTRETRSPCAAGQEPGLDDLFDDPIMVLLWQSDRLEPSRARALIRDLLARAESSRRAQSGLIRTRRARQLASSRRAA